MAGTAGKSGSAAIDGGTPGTPIPMLEATWNLDEQIEAVEITNFASSGNKEIVAGIRSWSVDVSGFVDASTTPVQPTGLVSCTLSDGTFTGTGDGIVTSFKPGVDARGAVTLDLTIEGSGAPPTLA